MIPKATVKVFGDILEKHSREYLEIFDSIWEKKKHNAMATLLRDESETYFHSFFKAESEEVSGISRVSENLRRPWGQDKEEDMFVVMNEIWQEQYVARAREDLAGRTLEEVIPAKTVRAFEKALEYLVRDYPGAQKSLDLLRAEPELCIHAFFIAMRQKQVEEGVIWSEFTWWASPNCTKKARQDIQDATSA